MSEPSAPSDDVQEWIVWLAKHWDGDIDQWFTQAKADNSSDLEAWLRDNAEYGETVKRWNILSAIETLEPITVPSERNPLIGENECMQVAELLIDQLVMQLSTPNQDFSFCFVDIKNCDVTVEWNEQLSSWICFASVRVHYDGLLLPDGDTPNEQYYNVSIGSFRLMYGDGMCTLMPIPSDFIE